MKQDGKFLLFTKEEFKTWLSQQKFTRTIKLIQNHHTYSPSYKHFKGDNHFAMLKSMENFHMNDRGFSEIAQNITTFPDGTIAVCRNINTSPAGIKGANAYGICIEHVGNFDIGGDTMTQAHKDTIVALNAILCDRFKLTPNKDSVVYHAWYNLSTGRKDNESGMKKDGDHKTCAGTNFFGGNSLQSAMLNFYPLIAVEIQKMNAPKEPSTQDMLREALSFLSSKSGINADLWYTNADSQKIPYLDVCLIKIAKAWQQELNKLQGGK